MRTVKEGLKLKPIAGGFYTLEGYTPPPAIAPTKLRRITQFLMRKVRPPAKAS
jgi:hypothetical protein